MDVYMMQGMLPIVVVCGLIFFLLFLKSKSSIIVRFIQRGVLGFVSILLGNALCSYLSLGLYVGINPGTILTGAILGLPGVCGLFLLGLL